MTKKSEKIPFAAEIGKVLNLMINSLYTNKDIFLRELISNASDACDKLRYLSITESKLQKYVGDFKISISVDEKEQRLVIQDNGIGMNRQDLIDNIGTIASSGTQKFIQHLTGENKKDVQLIGQFGVGFYSAFMIADKVTVTSKKAGEDQAWKWESDGQGDFEISEVNAETLECGTIITMHLKEDAKEYLDKFRVQHIITTYSDHISLPIEFIDEEGKAEIINKGSALWSRPKSEISDEQYQQFYKHVSHSPDEPWLTLHNKSEGNVEFTNLLFIPSKKPFDLFHPDRISRVKLYVKRVFITEESVNLIPAYLRFLRGVVDSEDLPLNISRETLQHNNIIDKIRKAISKKVFAELKKKLDNERESYETFWLNFGSVIKEGLCESLDHQTRQDMMQICLFKSVLQDKYITLDEYMSNMKENQDSIYHFNGDDADKLKNSPQIEGFLKAGIDVLLFTDHVDDFWVNVEPQYKDKPLKSITRAGIDLDNLTPQEEQKEVSESETADNEQLISFCKNSLSSLVADVKISGKLVDSPVCLAVNEGAMDIRMERFLKEQKQLPSVSAKILEINPKHSIIKQLGKLLAENHNDEAEELVSLLFDQACIIEGEPINDTGSFARKLNKFLGMAIKSV